MLSREEVRDSCSVRLWESIFSVIDVVATSEDVVAAVSSAGSGDWACLERREGGKSWSRSVGGGSGFVIIDELCASVAGSEGVSLSSISSDGVSSPSRSSPSDMSSSVSFPNYGQSVTGTYEDPPWHTCSSSCNRSLSCWIVFRFRSSSVCASCFFDWTLTVVVSCSSRKSSVRAYSRFCTNTLMSNPAPSELGDGKCYSVNPAPCIA
jgi:hypothetical protein